MSADPRRRRRYRREPVALSERVGRFRGGRNAPGGDLAALQAAWPGVAGPEVAANTTVVRRSRAGVVTVACSSSVWAQELQARADVLADQLVRVVPDVAVTGVRFFAGDHAVPPPAALERPPTVTPSEAELADAGALVRDVSDPELRDLLARAAAGQMAVARERRKSLQNAAKDGRVGRED